MLEVKGKFKVSPPSDVINGWIRLQTSFRFVVHSEARTRLDNLAKNPDVKYMDFVFMKYANVAFSVVPETEIEFVFDFMVCFGISFASYAVSFH